MKRIHTMPFGARILDDGSVLFRFFAPSARAVDLCLDDDFGGQNLYPMDLLPDGWFQIQHSLVGAGTLYRFRIDFGILVPDPASRAQRNDVHGPSIVVEPRDFLWKDGDWQGRPWEEAIFYEIHTGTFSPAGTFAGIKERLPYLADLGITAIELMPIAAFPGVRNWGYDGVLLFAPDTSYGSPHDLKQLVQTAHAMGIMVFLDVVYNHFGPEGNYLSLYAGDAFFTTEHHTPWGAAINFSGRNSKTVREFFIHNALYWLEEYHLDGLRLDAVHTLFDESQPDILEEIASSISEGPGKTRQIHLVLENDNNEAHYLHRAADGSPQYYTAQWHDDLHHAFHVLLTGEKTGCYTDYTDDPLQLLGRCLTEGFAFKSSHLPPQAFVSFLQNHDQTGNRILGERLTALVSEPLLRIAAALVLLAPLPPLLFMGEEFAATTPFFFFCDFAPELAEKVAEGRRQEFEWPLEYTDSTVPGSIPDPGAIESFHRSCINWREKEMQAGCRFLQLYKNLLSLRHKHIIPHLSNMKGGKAKYRIIGSRVLHASWILGDGSELQVVVNFATEAISTDTIPSLSETILYSDPVITESPGKHGIIAPQSILWLS
ncbi:MAG: malto-oligosyltrehalose trehalohydrolase [Thermodesulfobacteriota bacterium]|nr:malto-oligosyltrehalose trehalohydrolase [Thermodesulfobacteriota bacterium]